jgi:alpha-tubulin suppressor-like RCC1 family protein
MIKVFAGHSACHAFFLNQFGDIYAYGRNEVGQTGLPISEHGSSVFTATRLDRGEHFVPELSSGPEGDIVQVACGRFHTLVCTRGGSVYAAGKNANGQCGSSKLVDLERFRKIEVAPFVKEKDPVVMVGAGITFSLICTASGKGKDM